MSWFGSKKTERKTRTTLIAIEAISDDIAAACVDRLQQELQTSGMSSMTVKFPSTDASNNVPGLFDTPELLHAPESVGMVAALDRARAFAKLTAGDTDIIIATGSGLATAGWLATQLEEYGERVSLYRWLDELEHRVFGVARFDLSIYIDTLPQHLGKIQELEAPPGWGSRPVPKLELLRERLVEATTLLPGVKRVAGFRGNLLKPDQEIYNDVWHLVRRIVLKSNLPPQV